jgi:hypothetical protein
MSPMQWILPAAARGSEFNGFMSVVDIPATILALARRHYAGGSAAGKYGAGGSAVSGDGRTRAGAEEGAGTGAGAGAGAGAAEGTRAQGAGDAAASRDVLDGLDFWQSMVDQTLPSPRTEALLSHDPITRKICKQVHTITRTHAHTYYYTHTHTHTPYTHTLYTHTLYTHYTHPHPHTHYYTHTLLNTHTILTHTLCSYILSYIICNQSSGNSLGCDTSAIRVGKWKLGE